MNAVDFTNEKQKLIEFSSLANSITDVDKKFTTKIEETVVLLSHKKPDGHGEGLVINESNLEDTDKSRMKQA